MKEPLDLVENARRTLRTEAAAILSVAHRISTEMADFCNLVQRSEGRIVFIGIGKSGHIARKLAATFSSTGTPAMFVHAAEAAHGDLGMIRKDDVAVLLSNSGETPEIVTLLPFLKRRSVPLVSILGAPNSTLARASQIVIDVSVEREACPLGLAPTSSAIAALSIGDAIAINLIEMRGFSPEEFALSHPGGALGRRLLITVRDIMRKEKELPLVSAGTIVKDAILEVSQKGMGITGVLGDDQKLLGVFTDGDLRRTLDLRVNFKEILITEVMTRNPRTIGPDALATEALGVMQENSVSCLFVVEAGIPVGAIHFHDLLRNKII